MRKGRWQGIVRCISSILVIMMIAALFAGCGAKVREKPGEQVPAEDTAKDTTDQKTTDTTGTKPEDTATGTTTPGQGKDTEAGGEKTEGTKNEGTKNEGTLTGTTEPTKSTKKTDIKVKGLYLTGWTVGSMKKVQHFIDLAKTTEINSYVVDIKDDDGYVGYESDIPEVKEIGAWQKKYNVDAVLKAFHDNDVHVIGRIVCFKDPILSSKKPELAIQNVNGGLWQDRKKKTWLDPYDQGSWPYLVAIAKEAVQKGFDEIQFDYIRFANDGDKKAMKFDTNGKKKHEIINEFLAYARKEMPDVVLSADVFGIILESPEDREDIGQYLELMGRDMDYLSPMVYPSHYALGQGVNGKVFKKPDLDPYGVVYQSLLKAKNRLDKEQAQKVNMRAYLQDFTASWIGKGNYQTYGPQQIREQIKAVYDAGYDEWLFWDAGNSYSEAGFEKE